MKTTKPPGQEGKGMEATTTEIAHMATVTLTADEAVAISDALMTEANEQTARANSHEERGHWPHAKAEQLRVAAAERIQLAIRIRKAASK